MVKLPDSLRNSLERMMKNRGSSPSQTLVDEGSRTDAAEKEGLARVSPLGEVVDGTPDVSKPMHD